MRFKPNTEEDIAAKSKPLTGVFPGTVTHAEDCQSKKGVDMIKLEVMVYIGEKSFPKTTYLHPAMEVLVYNFCKHADILEEYQQGELTADLCRGKDVMVKLGIEKGKDGYPDKSVIKDFVSKETPETKLGVGAPKPTITPIRKTPKPTDPDLDGDGDEVPF